IDEISWELVRTDRPDPATEPEAAALLRCHVKSSDPAAAGRAFSGAAVELALASYPGFHVTAPPSAASPFGIYRAVYLPQSDVPHVVVLADGTRIDIPPPEHAASDTSPSPASGADSRYGSP
ncbi:exopolyphosphatase, partial [Aeromicrobium phragmitis]